MQKPELDKAESSRRSCIGLTEAQQKLIPPIALTAPDEAIVLRRRLSLRMRENAVSAIRF